MTIELSETLVNEALEKLSWAKLSAHLATTALTREDVDKLAGLVKRSEWLVLKRANSEQEKKRAKLLQSLASLLDTRAYSDHAAFVREHGARLNEIDGVYQDILGLLKETKASAMSPELRVSALLDRSNHEYLDLRSQMLKAMRDQGVLDLGKVTLTNDDGHVYSPAGVHEALVAAIASTLGMEAHLNKWYDASGIPRVPSLPSASEEDRFVVGSVQLLAVSWRNWQFAERRNRYLDGVLEMHTDLHSSWTERGYTSLWNSHPASNELELYSHIANSRLSERLTQHLASVVATPHYRAAVAGIEIGVVDLLPHGAISLNELHGATALSQLLSSEITEDHSEYAGLTLAEWVRGYSALQAVCEAALEGGDPDGLTIRFTRPNLAALLDRLGLRNGKADIFIGHTIYRKASRDLFDQPLIQVQDGSLLLLGLSCAASSIPNVILSTLGMLEESLDGRGKRFEQRVIEFLRERGFDARNILCNRGGETYDYDVAFVWGDYLFLLECKSRGLAAGDPARTYYFSLGIRDVVKQVKRLANGLKKHPDILTTYLPEGVGKKVVHCVINSLPYALFDGIDGIYFTDEGSFTRFFQQSEIGPRSIDPDEGIGDIDPKTAVAFMWNGERPTPEDLLRHLGKPIQLVMAMAHMKLSPNFLPVAKKSALRVVEYGREDSTTASYRMAAREAGYRTGASSSEGQSQAS